MITTRTEFKSDIALEMVNEWSDPVEPTDSERAVGRPVSPSIRWIYAPSENIPECQNTARPFDCEARPKQHSYETMPITFTCDLETLTWRYDYTGQLIIGYTQPSWDPVA